MGWAEMLENMICKWGGEGGRKQGMNVVRLVVLMLEGGFMACQVEEFKGGDVYFRWVAEAIITKSPWAMVTKVESSAI